MNWNDVLFHAVSVDSVPGARMALNAGAAVDARGKYGDTPLHAAILRGSLRMVRCLVEHGAPLEAGNNDGCTPLILAAANSNYGAVRYLIAEAGADIAATDCDDDTALHVACSNGDLRMVRLLLGLGVPVTLQPAGAVPVIFRAVASDDPAVLREVMAHCPPELRQAVLEEGYFEAAQCGFCQSLAFFLDRGLVNAVNHEGETALHVTAREGYEELVALLLARGADPHARNGEGRTALEELVNNGLRGEAPASCMLQLMGAMGMSPLSAVCGQDSLKYFDDSTEDAAQILAAQRRYRAEKAQAALAGGLADLAEAPAGTVYAPAARKKGLSL